MRNKLLAALAIISLWFVCLAPAYPGVEAAKGGGGVRMSAPKASLPAAAPKAAVPKASAPAAPAAKANTKVNRNEPVKDLPNEQRINTAGAAVNTSQRSSSRWGSALRNIGLFTGGMFLGSLLSHSLGWGNMDWGADFLGLLINLILLLIVIRLLLSIWRFLRRR